MGAFDIRSLSTKLLIDPARRGAGEHPCGFRVASGKVINNEIGRERNSDGCGKYLRR
jgi:hypothetical protein